MKRLLIFRIIFVAMISGMLFLVPCQVISKEDPVLKEIEALIERVDSLMEAGDVDQAIGISFFASRRYSCSLAENSPAELIYKFITQEKLPVKAEKSG